MVYRSEKNGDVPWQTASHNQMVTRKTLEDDGKIMQVHDVHEQVCPEMVFSVLFSFVSWVLWWLKWDLSDQTWGISLIDDQTQICYQKAPKMGKTLLVIKRGKSKSPYKWRYSSENHWYIVEFQLPHVATFDFWKFQAVFFGSPVWQWNES